jgi:hypothetical protein
MSRSVAVLVLLLACKQSAPKEQPAPPAGSGSGSAVVANAPIDAPAPDAPAPDAPAVAITLTKAGFSVMPAYKRTGKSDEEVVADIRTKLAVLPSLKVSFEVMEYADEREEGYFSVKHGETEVAQLFRTDPGDGIDVRVVDLMVPTEEGIRVHDKASVLFAKHPEITCEAVTDSELGLLQCRGAPGDLVYVLDADGYKGKRAGKLPTARLADRPIFMIAAGV